jgi:hypothetical protein
MVSLNKQVCNALLIGLLSWTPLSVIAQDLSAGSLCPVKEFHSKQGAVRVWQHQFEDGVFDLVIAQDIADASAPIVRLSFGGSNEAKCHFPEVSVLKGGDWGWHVAWISTNQQAIFYTRIDGEAWVSFPPQKMVHKSADTLQLHEISGLLLLQYHLLNTPTQEQHALESKDEGRNFSVVDK